MNWTALLQPEQHIALPWVGGRSVQGDGRRWSIRGKLPLEYGWHSFQINGSRNAKWVGEASPDFERLARCPELSGYLVGDRLILDSAGVADDPERMLAQTLKVHLLETGLERFARIKAAHYEKTAWIYAHQMFPQGPEYAVAEAYLNRQPSVRDIVGVTPALDAAFRLEMWHRNRIEEARRQTQLRLEAKARQQRFEKLVGTGAGRRKLAQEDFQAAAVAALQVSGAELLDHRPAPEPSETIVQFRHLHQRFACIVQTATLRIVDAGICLEDHYTGERGDGYFTLESLPAVISEAFAKNELVVLRNAR